MLKLIDLLMVLFFLFQAAVLIRIAGKKRISNDYVDSEHPVVDWCVSLALVGVMGIFVWRCLCIAFYEGG